VGRGRIRKTLETLMPHAEAARRLGDTPTVCLFSRDGSALYPAEGPYLWLLAEFAEGIGFMVEFNGYCKKGAIGECVPGYIRLHRGVLSPLEMLEVLAHEVGHAVAHVRAEEDGRWISPEEAEFLADVWGWVILRRFGADLFISRDSWEDRMMRRHGRTGRCAS
jgi:hypothetical protein